MMIISSLKFLAPALAMTSVWIDSAYSETRTNTRECLESSEVSDCWDYFPEKVVPHHSEHWDMTYHRTYKILYNKVVDESYLMYQCGTNPPESEVGKHNLTFAVPLQGGLAITQTTQINQLEQLGLRRQIKAYIGNVNYISSPCLKTLTDQNVTDTVYDSTAAYYYKDGSDVEGYLEENPDLVIIHGSAPNADSPSNGNNIIVSEASEADNKAIFEWHKVYASFYNLEKEANDQFEASSSRFDCAAANAEYLSTTVLDEKEKPNVLWGYFSDYTYNGVVYQSWSVATCDPKKNYYCEYAETCFSNLLHSKNSMTTAEFMNFGKEADVWIYSGYNWADVYEKFGSELEEFKSVKNNAVYDVLGSGSGPWFEQRSAEYDVVQQDFCEVVGHTDDSSQPHERVYLRKVLPLGVEEVGSLGDCDLSQVDVQWESRASECVPVDDSVKIPDPPNRLGPNDRTTKCMDPFSAALSIYRNSITVLSLTIVVSMVAYLG